MDGGAFTRLEGCSSGFKEGCTFIEELKLKYVIMETAYDGIWLKVEVLGFF